MSDLRETANELALMLVAFQMDPRTGQSINRAKKHLFEAADALEDLRAENERLREALETIRDRRVPPVEGYNPNTCAHRKTMDQECELCTVAFVRAALKGDDNA